MTRKMAAYTASSKTNVLMIVSAAAKGVSAQAFVQTYTILQQAQLQIQLASPSGKEFELTNQDDINRKWIADFKSKSYSHPIALDSIDASRYSAVVIPHSMGAIQDLAKDKNLGDLLNHFLDNNKAVCAVGQGCAALCSARTNSNAWSFKGRCLTSLSLYEVARLEDFASTPLIIEDFMKDNGANHTAASPDKVHIVVDGNVVTGQNQQSTILATQNLVFLIRPRAR